MEEKVSEENTEEVKMLEAQISHLQAEVAALQRQQRENHKDMTFNFQGHMQDALWVSFLFFISESFPLPAWNLTLQPYRLTFSFKRTDLDLLWVV